MIETYNIITIGVLDEDKKLVGITEENFKNLLKKAEKLDELQTRMKEIYGEGEELLETFVSGLEQYNSQQEEHPFKARLLTNETVDEWEAYQRAKSEETYNIITIGVLDEDKKLVGITEENFKNLLKKAEKLDELQTRMKEIYGEGEELLETFVSGLEQYNSQQEEHPFKARLLTNETVDEWEAYQRAKSEERLIELPTKIIRDGVSCPMVYHFYNVPYPEEEDIEECHLFEYIYKDSQLYLGVSDGPYSTVSIEATEIGKSIFFSKEEALRKIHEIHRDYEIVDDKVIPRQRTKQKKD